jgi:hypothetical protein
MNTDSIVSEHLNEFLHTSDGRRRVWEILEECKNGIGTTEKDRVLTLDDPTLSIGELMACRADLTPLIVRSIREEGINGFSVETTAGNGRDFWADGDETDWQDHNGLEANEPELLAAARAAAAAFSAIS